MSGFGVKVTRDTISPSIRGLIGRTRRPQEIWRTAATEIISITQRSFRDPSMRSAPWPAKKSGQPSNLLYKGPLRQSIRLVSLHDRGFTVGSDRRYAARHQLGYPKGGTPPRRFFPFLPDGNLAPQHIPRVRAVIAAAAKRQLGMK